MKHEILHLEVTPLQSYICLLAVNDLDNLKLCRGLKCKQKENLDFKDFWFYIV